MGFTKTTEGRIFFTGANANAAASTGATETAPGPFAPPPAPASQSADIQLQILGLLRSLNEKLKSSQADQKKIQSELERHRLLIERLSEQSEYGLRAMNMMEQKIAQNEIQAFLPDTRAVETAEALSLEMTLQLENMRRLLSGVEQRQEEDRLSLKDELQTMEGWTRSFQQRFETVEQAQADFETRQTGFAEGLTAAQNDYAALLEKLDGVIDGMADAQSSLDVRIANLHQSLAEAKDALEKRTALFFDDQAGIEQAAREDQSAFHGSNHGQGHSEGDAENPNDEPAAENDLPPETPPSSNALPQDERDEQDEKAPYEFSSSSFFSSASFETPAAQDSGPRADDLPLVLRARLGEDAYRPMGRIQGRVLMQSLAGIAVSVLALLAALAMLLIAPPAPLQNPMPAQASAQIDFMSGANDRQISEMFDAHPDALAAQLNRIEPQNADAAAKTILSPEKTGAAAAMTMQPDPSLPPALRGLEKKAFAGKASAQHDLGALYASSRQGVGKDYERALFWFGRAAAQGQANAQYNLGVMHQQGLGVKADPAAAVKWYQKAAAQGHAEAQYNLGIAYVEAAGIEYDAGKAAENFRKAAQSGLSEAAYNLGMIYENGLIGAPDDERALVWYARAAQKGNPEAKAALDQLVKILEISPDELRRITGRS